MDSIIKNTLLEYMVPMRDGVNLYTLVQLPQPNGKFPTIIKRNPYADITPEMEPFRTENTHGYAIVYQECRGTGRSEGDCIPYINEHNDGLDTLDWIRKQDFYNGELFLEGASYLSSVHFSYLKTNQPDIKAACLMVQDTERYNLLYRKGVLKNRSWSVSMYKKKTLRKKNFVPETFRTLPLKGISKIIFGEQADFFEDEISHPDPADPFWLTKEGGSDYSNAVRDSNVPVLLATAFYDIYTDGIFDIWNSLPESRRKDCALIVSPFDHNWSGYGKDREGYPVFPNARIREVCPDWVYVWFDHIRKGTPLNFIRRGEIAYYPMFHGPWKYEKQFSNGTKTMKLYLDQDRKLLSAPEEKGEITYLYNPYAPAEFKGSGCYTFGSMQFQDKPDSRYDIISFLSEPFEKNLLIKGTGTVDLHVKSTAPDTCFYVRLSIVREDGTLVLRDDIDTLCRTNPDYQPGETAVLHFDFAEHCYEVKKGESLRLDVSSSCVPHFLVHTNRKGPMIEQTGADIAYNTVCTGDSLLTLYFDELF
ncbi:MAG: CocE/NonD family hydrolase [Lentisphaeria bacterium]|nr:CocE/NonD family hydrolase [Lentisphaeria bacterium]